MKLPVIICSAIVAAAAGVALAQSGPHLNPNPGDIWTYFGPSLGSGWGPNSGGGGGSPGGTNGQVQYNNAGGFGGFTVSGDGTLNTTTGVFTASDSGVTPGSYTNANITVNSKGKVTAAASGSSGGLTIGTSTITGGTTNRLFYDNAGVLGEAVIGSGLLLSGGNLTATGGGSSTGFGVDGGTTPQTISNPVAGAATINNAAEEVLIASLNAATTLTLPAISAIPSPTTGCIRIHDNNQVSGTNTLTLKGNTLDGLNGGAANGTIGPFTTPNLFLLACASATHNWNVGPGTIATSTGGTSPQTFVHQITVNGAVYTQPAVADLSGLGTGVATAAGNNLSAAGGLTTTIASGTAALGTGAISSATCATVVTVAATNTLTTDVVAASFNGDPTAVTGYVPLTTGMLTIIPYPTANNVNFKVCNNTSGSITPGAITLNWRVAR